MFYSVIRLGRNTKAMDVMNLIYNQRKKHMNPKSANINSDGNDYPHIIPGLLIILLIHMNLEADTEPKRMKGLIKIGTKSTYRCII